MVAQHPCTWLYLLLFLLLFHQSHASDYGGCGGTVTVAPELSRFAKTKVDFTVVKIKLLSKDGVLKYSTECAPTGHYFVPTYDKGSFFLEIEGPSGWHFEPSRVPVTVGEDSPCGDHINFKFSGFSLRGKVSGAGTSTKAGPQGVTLILFSEGSQVGTTVSDETGSYVFHNVFPGDYEISASHPRWQISPTRLKTKMEWNNFEVGTSFVVSGFSVTGTVLSGDEPVPEVDFYLYSEIINSAGCTAPPAGAPTGKSKGKLLCATKSNSKGEFHFASVPPGDYTLVPIYSSAHTTFDVAPTVAPLHVGNRDEVVVEPFRVVGFGASGKVVAGTKGVENVRVLVNGVEKAVTGKDGSYRLEQFKAGTYDITAEKASYKFGALKGQRVSASSPRIADIPVAEVSVCGTLSIAHPPPNVKVGLRDVQVKSENGKLKQQTVQADKDGKYCVSLPAGKYTITPIVSSSEEKAGLNFSPPQATVEVALTPLNDINFSQLRVTVSGRVVCLTNPCDKAVSVALHPNTAVASSSSITTGLGLTDNQFTLRDVLPGSYKISVNYPNDAWCWEVQSRDLPVSKDITNIEFVQSGYVLPVTSPHAIQLHVAHAQDKKDAGETHTLQVGTNRLCVKQPGKYTVTPKACFKFGQDSFVFDTTSPRPLELQTSHVLVPGTVTAEKVSSVEVRVMDQQGNVLETVTAKSQNDNTLRYEYWALPGASLTFKPSTPKDNALLPYPPTREYTVPETTSTCISPLPAFEMRKGRFLSGKIVPGISGVRIAVKGQNGEELAHVLTTSDGSYSVGPLYDGEHTVSAQKEDFHFQRDESGLTFRAAKLGRLRVLAVDAASGDAIPGVLLSLSGEGYHNNSAIPVGGTLVFSDLFPGDYFLRAHLKEYSFHPSHASITVVEGQEASHKFLVTRVAFSCFGSVKGMNSLPERGVIVLAQPTASGSTASLEETQTDSVGNFRLRGLTPGVTYSIYVKNSIASASSPSSTRSNTGDLAIPESLDVTIGKEDIRNADFVMIRKPQNFDILGCVNVSQSHLHTLTANLYDSRSSDSVIRSVPLGCTKTFLFNDLPSKSDTEYIIRLTSSLSPRSYQISISPDVTVHTKQISTPRTSCLQFTFDATLKNDVTEVPVQGISSFVILLVLPLLAFRYRVQLMPIAKMLYMKYLAFQARRAGVAPPKQGSKYNKKSAGRETSQNEFDFLPPGLSNFSPKPKQKTKTK